MHDLFVRLGIEQQDWVDENILRPLPPEMMTLRARLYGR
jgi:hypothetical protein